jgi:hypothetical protein
LRTLASLRVEVVELGAVVAALREVKVSPSDGDVRLVLTGMRRRR